MPSLPNTPPSSNHTRKNSVSYSFSAANFVTYSFLHLASIDAKTVDIVVVKTKVTEVLAIADEVVAKVKALEVKLVAGVALDISVGGLIAEISTLLYGLIAVSLSSRLCNESC